MSLEERKNSIQTIANRILYRINHTSGDYSKQQVIAELCEFIPDDKLELLAFAIGMTPIIEVKTQEKEQ